MNPAVFDQFDEPGVRAWLSSEEEAVAKLKGLADRMATNSPERSMYLRVQITKRTNELLAIREWLDLR